jgi:hypothetical protein
MTGQNKTQKGPDGSTVGKTAAYQVNDETDTRLNHVEGTVQ